MEELNKARYHGSKIGFTSTVGDLLHAGHIAMLMEASQQCDFLVVGLLIDPTYDRPEKNEPVQSILERYIQLSAISFVNMVIPLRGEQDLVDVIKLTAPDIRIVGEEYRDLDFTGKDLCPIYYNKRQHSFSSTQLRNRIKT